MTFAEKTADLYSMINNGQLLEAFDKFYAEEVIMQEMGENPRVGKALNREFEVNFLNSIEAVHGAGVHNITSDENKGVVMVENWMDLTFKGGHRVKMEQVCVQEWKDEQIINERFYHR